MNRKKEGSLTGRKTRTQGRSLDTGRESSRRNMVNNKPLEKESCHEIDDIAEFIESYYVMKQAHEMNTNSQSIYEQQSPSEILEKEEDEEFCFDVDLGVPYVESHHLDSGFEYEDKCHQAITMNTMQFPKVSSAKEIFTSVLELDHTLNSQSLEEENFTDQEEESESSFYIKRSADFNKKRSRKQNVTVVMDESYLGNDNNANSHNSKKGNQKNTLAPRNSFCNDSVEYIDQEESIVERLKSTVISRENKLEYWNQRLIELEDSKISLKDNSIVSLSNQFRNNNNVSSQYIHTKSPSILSNLTILNKDPIKKKSKFEKLPIKKVTPIVVEVSLNKNTNKENITPSRLKLQPKNGSYHKSITTVTKEKNIFNINRTETNEKGNSRKDEEHLLYKENSKSNLFKDRSFVKKVF